MFSPLRALFHVFQYRCVCMDAQFPAMCAHVTFFVIFEDSGDNLKEGEESGETRTCSQYAI